MPTDAYFIIYRDQKAGPYTLGQVHDLIASGQISAEQLGWCAGMAEWRPLSDFLPPKPAPRLPPPIPPAARAVPKTSGVWLWVILGCVLAMGGCVALIGFGVTMVMKEGTDEMSFKSLVEERAQHQPKWRKSSFEPAGPADEPAGEAFDLIRYRSPAGELAAYLTPDPKDGKKHPAIVWAHGGFGGIGSYFWEPQGKRNDQSARAFREKGIVMMCPSWRGENDNPGRFELFYGELDDFLAAIEHVKALPYVDPQRVYIGGHSTGGTMTLLAAVSSDQFRAAFSFGGMIDGVETLGDGEGYGNTPYDPNSNIDHRLRSPMRYAGFIRRPTFYFEGGDYYDEASAALMQLRARKTFHAFHLPGDHFDVLRPTTELIAEKILRDDGDECRITFTAAELRQRYAKTFTGSLAAEITRWSKSGGSLAEALEKADPDDWVPRSAVDVKAAADAVKKLSDKKDFGAMTTIDIAALVALGNEIEDEDVYDAFDAQVLPPVFQWMQARLARADDFEAAEAESFFDLLEDLAETYHEDAVEGIVRAARHDALRGSYQWKRVFGSFDEDHPDTERLMAAFQDDPPDGLVGVLLLDAANNLFLDDWKGPHPFASEKGAARLRTWLESRNPDDYSYAHSAAIGAAFIGDAFRSALLVLAHSHPDQEVQMEGAWADAKTGGSRGVDLLKKACLELHQSERARDYLEELGHEKEIPAAALEPAFAAQADMSHWLQHPNELGAAPLSIEIYDHKELFWPPTEDKREIWLIKFAYKFEDDEAPKTGYGSVGSMTWSSFEEFETPPKPEDLYLHHCTLEQERDEKRTESAAKEGSAKARALAALKKGNPGVFDAVTLPPDP